MSKDIWHKPSETTDVDNNLIIDDWTNGTYELGYFDDNDMIFRNFRNDDVYDEESMMRWCDVDDLIDDYTRTRKALEIAVDALKDMNEIIKNYEYGNGLYYALDGHDTMLIAEDVEKALYQITALEQKDTK